LSERVHLSENWAATLRGHTEILDAIRRAKRKAASARMRAHLRQVLEVMTGVEKDNGAQ
jgi:DNA-binding GntR family transcriptional regulator